MLLRLLHRLLEIFLHVERRIEQPFLRPAFNAVFRMPMATALTWLQNLGRSRENVGLAEETPQLGEDEDTQTMIDEMRRHLKRDFPRGGFERAGNTKTHGLVRGELTIHDGLPENLRRGLFATPASFRCWVRFSGPGPHIEPDINDVGFASISVKVMGVPGEKLWDDEQHTQDFTSVCTPTFVTPNVKANARLQYWSRRHLPVFYFLDPRSPHLHRLHDAGPVERDADQSARADLLFLRSLSPRAGAGDAVQLLADDQGADERFPACRSVRRTIICATTWSARSMQTDVEFELRVQVQTDPFLMPIENNAVMWPTRLSPRVPVATLRIPRQKFDTPDQFDFARNLRFNPWHCLPDHRPLGNQSRARKRMYDEMASFRQRMNGVPHIEPTGDEVFGPEALERQRIAQEAVV